MELLIGALVAVFVGRYMALLIKSDLDKSASRH